MLPKEFYEDLKNKRPINSWYYLFKLIEWNHKFDWPKAEIVKSIGQAGDLTAETLRLIKQFDLFEAEFS